MAYAGPEAERHVLGRYNEISLLDDGRFARQLAERFAPGDREWLRQRQIHARALVETEWAAVERVAEALVDQRRLPAPEVRSILGA